LELVFVPVENPVAASLQVNILKGPPFAGKVFAGTSENTETLMILYDSRATNGGGTSSSGGDGSVVLSRNMVAVLVPTDDDDDDEEEIVVRVRFLGKKRQKWSFSGSLTQNKPCLKRFHVLTLLHGAR
jgi:hypothetical protein